MESNFIKSANIQPFGGTDDQYYSTKDHISASAIKRLKVSPAHFIEPEEVETDAMLFGSAYHCYILEPDKFVNDYYVFDDSAIYSVLIGEGFKSPRSTKQYKEWMESEMRLVGDRKSVSKDDFEKIKAMRERLMRHPYAKMLLSNGINEQGYFGDIETEVGNIKIKFKPDHINQKKHICIDLKTSFDASKDGFTRHAADLDYYIQAAFYSDLLERMFNDGSSWSFYFIAQEKKKPFAFNIFEASNQFISQGRYEYEMLLQLYVYCLVNNTWPGYQVWCENKYGILELKLPAWAIKDLTYYDHYSQKPVSKQLKLN